MFPLNLQGYGRVDLNKSSEVGMRYFLDNFSQYLRDKNVDPQYLYLFAVLHSLGIILLKKCKLIILVVWLLSGFWLTHPIL